VVWGLREMAEIPHERVRMLIARARKGVLMRTLAYRPLPFHERYLTAFRLGEKAKDRITGNTVDVVGGKRYRFLRRRR